MNINSKNDNISVQQIEFINNLNKKEHMIKIIRIIVGQGKESRNFPSDKIRVLRFPVNSRDFRRNFCRRGYYVRNFDSNRVEIRILDEI